MVEQPVAKKRWTTHDLEKLPENKWITYEIIAGELFTAPCPHYKHQQVTGRICTVLSDWSGTSGLGEAIFSPGLVLSETNDVMPDVVWITTERLASLEDAQGHLTGVPELVVEVLSSGEGNIRRDREAKLKLYSVQGAQEYWIADRFSQQLEVYRRSDARLVLTATLKAEDTLTSPLLPGFSAQVSQLFA